MTFRFCAVLTINAESRGVSSPNVQQDKAPAIELRQDYPLEQPCMIYMDAWFDAS